MLSRWLRLQAAIDAVAGAIFLAAPQVFAIVGVRVDFGARFVGAVALGMAVAYAIAADRPAAEGRPALFVGNALRVGSLLAALGSGVDGALPWPFSLGFLGEGAFLGLTLALQSREGVPWRP